MALGQFFSVHRLDQFPGYLFLTAPPLTSVVQKGCMGTLLDKPERRHPQFKIFEPNFCGVTVRADAFVVGHGID